MIDRIRQLESIARRLEPGAAERAALTRPVIEYAERFLHSLPERLTYVATDDQGAGLYESPIGEQGADIHTLLSLIERHVDRPGINPASGGHLGYIPGGGLFPSALGDYLADVTNRYAGVFFANPGAVRMEHLLTRWMAGAGIRWGLTPAHREGLDLGMCGIDNTVLFGVRRMLLGYACGADPLPEGHDGVGPAQIGRAHV